ncbi:hypothetical protein [Salinisphaera sp. G21_0]|uniref:hypothetical protein n=1 Tax=Salinisphaera sp. G21_0 TaxID=2821094 RepID=UPI001AD971EC|nr:hypothetical protein [Salinisphaera sp. G21_0]MBO9484301.1 hypothetical protein [Salinisphaera sp. G21_0]
MDLQFTFNLVAWGFFLTAGYFAFKLIIGGITKLVAQELTLGFVIKYCLLTGLFFVFGLTSFFLGIGSESW